MGLDIYAFRVKKSLAEQSNSNREIIETLNKEARDDYKKFTSRLLDVLKLKYEVCSPIEYAREYMSFIYKLKEYPLYSAYDFYLSKYGYNARNDVFNATYSPEKVEEIIDSECEYIYKISDAYFRKVNFLYEYFRDKLIDEECLVTKCEVTHLIKVCKEVFKRKDEKYARKKLPTTSGFFFGSTEYDDWYWNDVKDVITQMTKLCKPLNDDDYVLISFSW